MLKSLGNSACITRQNIQILLRLGALPSSLIKETSVEYPSYVFLLNNPVRRPEE